MVQKEIILFIIITSLVIAAFIAGVFIFLFQYRKKRSEHHGELKRKEDAHLRELHFARLEIQQETMQDIGQEIHDNVGQKLTLAALYTQQLDYEGKYPEINDRITSISNILNESLQELRNLSRGLSTGYFEQTELSELIQHECNRVTTAGEFDVKTSFEKGIRVDTPVKIVAVRILQEFLQNSLKHSGCRTIEVYLQRSEGKTELVLKDDGKGFDPSSAPESAGVGLKNFKRRAQLIGASLTLFSAPGEGTTLSLYIPETISKKG